LSLVLLSIFLAIFAAYIAFLVSGRIRVSASRKYSFSWLLVGAFALGSGVWAMHFVGMIAYKLPIAISYDVRTTIISVIPAIFFSLIVLQTRYDQKITIRFALWRSVLMGGGIGLMHYIGMSAMRMDGVMRYDPALFVLSIFVAVVLAGLSLWFKLRADKYVASNVTFSRKLFLPAVMMGCAISGMHYVGMAAVFVFPDGAHAQHIHIATWAPDELANIIGAVSVLLGVLLIIAIEVSYRLDLYRQIQEREQNLDITLNSIGDAVIATDAKGLVTRMNYVAEKLTGWSFQDANGQPVKNIFPIINATTRESIENPVEKVLSTGETIHLSNHTTLISKDGNEYQIADSAAPIRNRENNILGMILVFNDVTEQYRLRELATKNKRDLQAIMDYSPAVIYVKDLKGHYIFINRQFEMLFHVERESFFGKTDYDFLPKNIADGLRKNDQNIIESQQAIEKEEIVKHEDGFHTYVSTKFPLFNEKNEIYAICGISTDITQRKSQEEQLRRSQKMEALGKLTGGIAHDYNNMLGVILGYTELLEDMLDGLPEQSELKGFVNEISRAGERGVKLTKKLLSFSSQQVSDVEVLSLNSVLQDEKLMLEKTLTARIKLTFDLIDNIWMTYLDAAELEDAIVNMSINAMHAIEGNGELTIKTRNETLSKIEATTLQLEAGDYVLLSITDTGSGMNEETKEKIFEPFYSTKGEMGTGLGLSQVYGFVGRSHGAIKVYSEEGLGSRLTLYFPRYLEGDSKENIKQIEIDSNIDLTGTETILIVDDEIALRNLTSKILRQSGYQVLCAESGKQALELLEEETVDLLFSDVIMSGMDGYQLAAIVQEKFPTIKIQLASGFSDDRHVRVGKDILHKNLLNKPYSSEKLLKIIRELLN
jgi:PAS domain S-box-containing protein